MASMIRFFFILALGLVLAGSPAVFATPAEQIHEPSAQPPTTPVVLELFTSQDCTFCPQADALMGQMRLQDGVIVLSCHVDYFAASKPSIGQRFCTERQDAYNKLIGSGPRYTPQLIVNGRLDVIGYDAGRVSNAVMKARDTPIETIPITSKTPTSFGADLPKMETGDYSLMLMMIDKPRINTLTEGPQKGRSETYYNVVSGLKDLGTWDGAPKTIEIDLSFTPENQGFTLVVQDQKTGYIMAAGTIDR